MRAKAPTAKQPLVQGPIQRLRAALKPDLNFKRVKRDNGILLRLLPVIALPFAGAALLAVHPPQWPAPGAEPVAWLDVLFFCVAGLTIVGAFIVGANRVLKSWAESVPESPEAALREFYRETLSGRPSTRRLATLLARFDTPGPRVQPVYHWLAASAVPELDSPRMVAKYWRALVRGNKDVTRRFRITGLALEQPVADVALATVQMHATVTRKIPSFIATFVGVAIAVAPFFAGMARIERFGVSFWTAVAAACALGLSVGWLLRKVLHAGAESRDVAVHKLMVRQAHDWRLLSGEWESQDEADTAWLDPKLLK